MSAEPIEKTDLEILEDRLKKLETLSVREESDAARSCQHLITVVMCTFAPPKLAVVMNALLTIPEKTKITTKNLSEKMQLDKKQMREYLSNLKSMGYVLETTGMTEWAKQNRNNYNRNNYNRGSGKAAQYHVDYQYFIMMTKYRLHSILKRLNAQQKKEDDMGGGYVCCNEECFLCFKIKKIMDLIQSSTSSSGSNGKYGVSMGSHFICAECGNALIDAQKYWNNENATLTRTMTFNLQMQSLRRLLTATEAKVTVERIKMGTEISKIEDEMDRIKNGSSQSAYKAVTLNIGDVGKLKDGRRAGRTGLAHLDRIGTRRNYNKKDFLCKIETEAEDNDVNMEENKQNADDNVLDDAQFQKDVKLHIQTIREYEMSKQINNSNGDEGCDEDEDYIDLYPCVEIKVDGVTVKLSDILNDAKKYESKMSTEEWNNYQLRLDELGLLEID